MPTNYKSALSLFGRLAGVNDRITQTIRKKLNSKKVCEKYAFEDLEKYLNLSLGLLNQIKKGEEKADFSLFEKLEGPLDLPSIYDILGKPDFNTNGTSRQEWEKEQEISPMCIVARSGGQDGKKIPKRPIKLETYVTLRAIGELYRNNPRQG